MKGRRVVAEPVRNRKKERNNSLLLPSNKIDFLSITLIWFLTGEAKSPQSLNS
jgi:hypothetical protein